MADLTILYHQCSGENGHWKAWRMGQVSEQLLGSKLRLTNQGFVSTL